MPLGETLITPILIAVFAAPVAAQQATDAAIDWIKARAIPIKTVEAENGFEDLQPLKRVIGDARIVSLGESTHGSREIFQMKHRLVEFLTTEMGFTIFSIEANLPEAYRVNDYVLRGEGDPDRLIAGMYFWTWNTREMKDMVEWMRRFNQEGKGRIEFTGFDMQVPDVAMKEVVRFLEGADEDQAGAARAAYKDAKKSAPQNEFGVATGTFPAKAARGKKVTFRGWIKTDNVRGYAGLWWRCDGPNHQVLAFDNMASKEINGTRDWRQYSLELMVPAETTNINFGVLMAGQGTAWFDDLEVLLDGHAFKKPELFDFDFEADAIRGFFIPPLRGYRVELDADVSKSGKRSLRLRSVDPPSAPSTEDFKNVVAACEEVQKRLAGSRADLVKKHDPQDVDWAIVNARLVVSAMKLRSGNAVVRDAAMADNVQWILEQRPGAKIVLWAHNGHVGKQAFAMGKYLDRKFGKDHVAIAFATAKGEYQAIGKKGLATHPLQAPPAESYEAAFLRTGLPRFLLDLRQVGRDDEDSGWLSKPHPFRLIGALAMDSQFTAAVLPALYDAVLYLEDTTSARPLGP